MVVLLLSLSSTSSKMLFWVERPTWTVVFAPLEIACCPTAYSLITNFHFACLLNRAFPSSDNSSFYSSLFRPDTIQPSIKPAQILAWIRSIMLFGSSTACGYGNCGTRTWFSPPSTTCWTRTRRADETMTTQVRKEGKRPSALCDSSRTSS